MITPCITTRLGIISQCAHGRCRCMRMFQRNSEREKCLVRFMREAACMLSFEIQSQRNGVRELTAQSDYRAFLAKEAKSCGHAAVAKRRDAQVGLISLQNDTDLRDKT